MARASTPIRTSFISSRQAGEAPPECVTLERRTARREAGSRITSRLAAFEIRRLLETLHEGGRRARQVDLTGGKPDVERLELGPAALATEDAFLEVVRLQELRGH